MTLRLREALLALAALIAGCGDSSDPVSPFTPGLISTEFRSGQYTWLDRSDPVQPVQQFQFSLFRFFQNQSGQFKFVMRVDTTIANPGRRFNDLTADFKLTGDSVFISGGIINPLGASNNVPLGGFDFFPATDSLILFRAWPTDSQDTTMRISLFVAAP
ncbi:MAG: hypothetical protein ACE5GA_10055 [Candidatus Zixiibacteriota bacterium]